jgi:hypothetical protein
MCVEIGDEVESNLAHAETEPPCYNLTSTLVQPNPRIHHIHLSPKITTCSTQV